MNWKARTVFALLLLTGMAWGQYTTNFVQGAYDLTPNVKNGLNVWKTIGGTCQPSSGSMSYGGLLYYCVGTDNNPYKYDRTTHSWSIDTRLGASGMSALAVKNVNSIYALWSSSSCPAPDKMLWYWTPTNGWNYPGGTTYPNGTQKCLSHVSVGADGFLAGVTQGSGEQNVLWYSQDGGKTWVQWSTGWSYVHMRNVNAGCGISSGSGTSGPVYIITPNDSAQNLGGNFVGCMYGDQPFVLMAWDASGNVSMMDEQNGAWDKVSGLSASHIAGINKFMVVALDQSNVPHHWNIMAKYWQGRTTGTWNSGCPGPSSPCHSTTLHQSNLTVEFTSGHGLGNKSNIQKVVWNQAMNNLVWDFSPGCDPVFGDPADPECKVNMAGYETCLESGQDIGAATPPEPDKFGLSHDYQNAIAYYDRTGPELLFTSPNGTQTWYGSEQLALTDACMPGTFPTCPGPNPFSLDVFSIGGFGESNVLYQLNTYQTQNPFLSEESWDNGGPGNTVECLGDQITWGTEGNFDDPGYVPACD